MEEMVEFQSRCMECKSYIRGRSDKKFCSLKCKNAFNNRKNKQKNIVFKLTDQYLHKNRDILAELYQLSKGEEYIDPILLTSKAFRPTYITGTDRESIAGKTKYLIYDYAFVFEKESGVLIFKENE